MFPRWLNWLMMGLLVYLVVQGGQNQRAHLPTATPLEVAAKAQPERKTYPALAAATDMERWKKAVNPDYAARAQCEFVAEKTDAPTLLWKVTEDVAGSGEAAKCTDNVRFKLTVWNARGTVAYTDEVTLALGAREVAAGLDAALVGIRKGGVRTVILSPAALTRDSNAKPPKPLLNALGSGHVVIVTAERLL